MPDNLIFHLKRFDYDVMTGTRSKINDRFEFPETIDMAPYHVDYLKEMEKPSKSDWYELVGVLVHSGTAESGHYYSYIRERPAHPTDHHSWIEFNDMDVSKFDKSHIPEQCFGGLHENGPYTNRYTKVYSAYMLFYERIDRVNAGYESKISTSCSPAKCPIPIELQVQINQNNASWLQTYCMFDPAHATFSRQLLEQLRTENNGACSDDHTIEKEAICLSLDYLEKILSRSKDCPNFVKMLGPLQKVIGSCSSCCNLALKWVIGHKYALRNLLLRVPFPFVRKEFGNMILMALQFLKTAKPELYGYQAFDTDDHQNSNKELQAGGTFTLILIGMEDLWSTLWMYHRGWDDYFGLLVNMANLGMHESHQLMQRRFLQYCFEILVVEHSKDVWTRNSHYISFVRSSEKGRKYQMTKLVELLAVLFCRTDLKKLLVRGNQVRRMDMGGIPMTIYEDELMRHPIGIPRSKRICAFLDKILNIPHNPQWSAKIIRHWTLSEEDHNVLELIQKTIQSGIDVEPACLAEPWLISAVSYLECTPYENSAKRIIDSIASGVDTIGYSGGREHLDFFMQARKISSLQPTVSSGFFNRYVLQTAPQWAPALLLYWEEPIRRGTLDLLKILVFSHDTQNMDDEEYADLIESAGKNLRAACVRRCNNMVQLQKTIDSRSVEQIQEVIDHCKAYYDPDDEADKAFMADTDSKSMHLRVDALILRCTNPFADIMGNLQALTVEDVDEAASGIPIPMSLTCTECTDASSDMWNNNSDDMPSDSDSDLLTSP